MFKTKQNEFPVGEDLLYCFGSRISFENAFIFNEWPLPLLLTFLWQPFSLATLSSLAQICSLSFLNYLLAQANNSAITTSIHPISFLKQTRAKEIFTPLLRSAFIKDNIAKKRTRV